MRRDILRVSLPLLIATTTGIVLCFSSCATAPKNQPRISRMSGKRVAVVDIDGEVTQKKILEVALVNQIAKHGSFVLIPKEQVDHAKTKAGIDSTDWKQIANDVKAELALKMTVLDFEADVEEGVSEEVKHDEILEKERGKDEADATNYYPVKELTGTVRVELAFYNIRTPDAPPEIGFAHHEEKVRSEGKDHAIHLPPKLRFLEKVTNTAFERFFKEYE